MKNGSIKLKWTQIKLHIYLLCSLLSERELKIKSNSAHFITHFPNINSWTEIVLLKRSFSCKLGTECGSVPWLNKSNLFNKMWVAVISTYINPH